MTVTGASRVSERGGDEKKCSRRYVDIDASLQEDKRRRAARKAYNLESSKKAHAKKSQPQRDAKMASCLRLLDAVRFVCTTNFLVLLGIVRFTRCTHHYYACRLCASGVSRFPRRLAGRWYRILQPSRVNAPLISHGRLSASGSGLVLFRVANGMRMEKRKSNSEIACGHAAVSLRRAVLLVVSVLVSSPNWTGVFWGF